MNRVEGEIVFGRVLIALDANADAKSAEGILLPTETDLELEGKVVILWGVEDS